MASNGIGFLLFLRRFWCLISCARVGKCSLAGSFVAFHLLLGTYCTAFREAATAAIAARALQSLSKGSPQGAG